MTGAEIGAEIGATAAALDAGLLAVVAVTFLFGGLVKGAIGLGLPVVVIAILAPLIGLPRTLAIFLAPAIASNLWQALSGPAFRPLVARLWPFLLAALGGLALGARVLAGGDTRLLEALLGVLLLIYAAVSLATPQLPPPGRRERWMGPAAGGLGGVMFGMTGIYIVPGILYLQALGLPRDRLVQALGITFITISAGLAVALGGYGVVSGPLALVSLGAVAPTFAGLFLGRRLRHRISEDGFRRVFFIGLAGAAVFMIGRSLAGLA